MANLYPESSILFPDSNILHDQDILMNAVEKSNIPKVLSDRLNGTITFGEFLQIFLSLMDEYFRLLF